jgi:hypothetical protein
MVISCKEMIPMFKTYRQKTTIPVKKIIATTNQAANLPIAVGKKVSTD